MKIVNENCPMKNRQSKITVDKFEEEEKKQNKKLADKNGLTKIGHLKKSLTTGIFLMIRSH